MTRDSVRALRILPNHAPTVLAIVLTLLLGVLYPLADDRTADPLAVFVLPVLLIAALGSRTETLIVAVTATPVALAVGVAGSLDGTGLTVRMIIVAASSALAVVVARERERRIREIEATDSKMVRISRAMHAGKVGTWAWDSATGEVEWDDDLHDLFGLPHGRFEGTFDGWVACIHPDDRERVLRELDEGVRSRQVFGFDHRCVWPDGAVHWLHGVGEVVIGPTGEVAGAVGVTLDVDERIHLLEVERTSSERSRFLERTNRALIESLDLENVVERITSAAIQDLADWCSLIVTIDHPVDAPFISVAHRDPEMVVWAMRLQQRFPYDAAATSGAPQVVRTGSPEFIPLIDDAVLDAVVVDPELRQIVQNLELRSSIIVPVVGGLGTLGALQLVRTSTRPTFTEADLELALDLAGPIGSALNNTVLFRRQQAAQRALEGLQQLTAQLADLTAVDDIANAIVRSSAGLVRASKSVLYLAESPTAFHLAAHIGYEPHELEGWGTISASANAPIPDAIRQRAPIVATTRTEINARYPFMAELEVDDAAFVTLPLIQKGRVIGALFVAWRDAHVVSDTELDLLGNIASRCAGALERARLHQQQHAIATTLQRSLLPARLTTPEWFSADGHYWPGVEGIDVGGDFYDLFEVGQDRWALTIGDVCGKGVEAAALTSVARHTARSAARHVDSPAEVLRRIHEALESYDGASFCTVCFAFLERAADGVTAHVALGGHPQPLLRRNDGTVERIGRPGTLLGLFPPVVHTTSSSLRTGDLLVFYTDGVTDAPGALAVSADELADTVAAAGSRTTSCADAIQTLLTSRRPSGVNDDTALLLIEIGDLP